MATPTPIDVDHLECLLGKHPDPLMVTHLISGLRQGFDTGISKLPTSSKECNNLLSTKKLANQSIVDQLVAREKDRGYVIGPFKSSPFPLHRINPIGLVESKYSKKQRLIVDMSAPHEDQNHPSLNSLIDKNKYSLSYVRVDDAVNIIKRLGPGTWLSKTDITDAFKLIPIHPDLWHLHGFKWRGQFYYYTRLVFGSRSSPKIFDILSTALCWIAENCYQIPDILHLLDDFICFTAAKGDGQATTSRMLQMFQDVNIPLAKHKTVGPATCLEYLGIILDSKHMLTQLPEEKVSRILGIMSTMFKSSTASLVKRDFLVILGHLNFAMQVIRPGRTFIGYLLSVAHAVPNLKDRVYLSAECVLDFNMWEQLLHQWNGVTMFLKDSIDSPDFHLFTDAAGSIGHGGYFQGRWFSALWPTDLWKIAGSDMSIALLELFPIVAAALMWGQEWSQRSICFHCDNIATVNIINKGRSKSPIIMRFMRKLIMHAVYCNFFVSAVHVPGKYNSISDALSRLQIARFRKLAPHAEDLPTPCPSLKQMMYP